MKSEFQDRLSQLRAKRGLTQAALASKAGLPPAVISHFETGFRFPTAATLAKLADALDVEVDYLVGRDSTPKPSGPRIQAIFRHAQDLSETALEQLERFSEFLSQQDAGKRKAD